LRDDWPDGATKQDAAGSLNDGCPFGVMPLKVNFDLAQRLLSLKQEINRETE
jgi:hypothetical protein